MIPPTTDPADKRKADALDRWVERQKEEAMRNLPTDLEVLPSQLLLEQMEREAAQRQRVREGCFVPPPQLRCSPPASVPAAKPSSSSRRRNRRRAGVNSRSVGEEVVSLPADVRTAASKPASSSATALSARLATGSKPAPSSATAKFPRLAAALPMSSSAQCSDATPEELEERLSHKSAAAAQSTSCLQSAAAAAQPTPGLQGAAAAAQPTPGLQGAAAAAQPTPGLQGAAAAAQPTPRLQGAAAQPTPGLQGAAAAELLEGPEGGLPPLPGPEHLLSFLWGVLMELKSDTPQPDTPQPVPARPDTPQPVSISSKRHRGRRKRDASVHATGGLGDASAPAHATEGPADASAPSLQRFSGKLVLVLASEPCNEGFEEEAPPDPVSGDFKEQFVLVLAFEPRD
ncbi:hypothetical protein CRENBAI_005465 [Crenichthys baileyi]|uniref:Uncharacterized protein n=1 Tax=Crenichthys baileyi TaxID=28760 RepID=A0AAV9S6I5_9TELE